MVIVTHSALAPANACSGRPSLTAMAGGGRREHDSDDRRMMLVHLTQKGHAALREILPGHFKRMAALMAPLSEHERKTLVRLLDKVAGQASAMGPGARSQSQAAAV